MTTGTATEAEQRALLAKLVRTDSPSLGLPSPTAADDAVGVVLLGSGQNYSAWQVTIVHDDGVPAVSFTVRIARRALDEMPRPMATEFAAMSLVPAGIGPTPVLLEKSAERLGAPFMVTGFVPGRTVQPRAWTARLLLAHARQMAVLHERAYPGWGEVTVADKQLSASLDMSARFRETLAEWREDHPEIIGESGIARLLPRVESFIAKAAPTFRRFERFSLIHGDLGTPNVVVDGYGLPRFVDWEYAQIGDPALDLATLGGAVPALPWYLPLKPADVDLVLHAYLDAPVLQCGHARERVEDLRLRRDVWEVFERFFSLVYFRVQAEGKDDGWARHAATAAQLQAGLDSWLN